MSTALLSDFPLQQLPYIQRIYFRILTWFLDRFYPTSNNVPGVYRINSTQYLKYGQHVTEAEARSMCFVRENTSIPVPRLYGFWYYQETPKRRLGYIVMEAMPGKSVDRVWNDWDTSKKEAFKGELEVYMRELRGIKQPIANTSSVSSTDRKDQDDESHTNSNNDSYYIGAYDRQPLNDLRISQSESCGPFNSIKQFQENLMPYIRKARGEETVQRLLIELNSNTTGKQKRICFTHGDLTPRNILVDTSTGKITAVLDWEQSAWICDYWEVVKAVFATPSEMKGEWKEVIMSSVGDFEREYEADLEMQDIYGFPY